MASATLTCGSFNTQQVRAEDPYVVLSSLLNKTQSSGSSILAFVNTANLTLANYQTIESFFKRITKTPVMYLKRAYLSYFGGFHALEQAEANLTKNLEQIKGQESAKEAIRKSIITSLTNMNPLSDSSVKGSVIYIAGPSGVGKSYMVDLIINSILKRPKSDVFKITPLLVDDRQEVLKSTYLRGKEVADQSLATIDGGSNLPIFLMQHPQCVIWIDEIDKMKNVKIKDWDEIIRNIIDSGKYIIDGCAIDCSKIIFIFTSNESKMCLDPQKNNSNDIEENSKTYAHGSEDGTTFVHHDASLVKRLHPIIFEKLKSNDLKAIAKSFLDKKIEFFKSCYDINITYDDAILDGMAKYAEQSNKQGRGITFDLEDPLTSTIQCCLLDYRKKGRITNNRTFELSYKLTENDDENPAGKFEIKETEDSIGYYNSGVFSHYVVDNDKPVELRFQLDRSKISELLDDESNLNQTENEESEQRIFVEEEESDEKNLEEETLEEEENYNDTCPCSIL